jgi:DNA polymerase I
VSKLIIIDGNAILHRAYHAYPALTNNKGQVINAVYGFFSMLFSIIADQKPEYLAVCFDMAAPTFRKAMFVGYHANRIELPEDFVPQIVLVHELLEKMKVGIFELEGYEADDLIGTLAVKAVGTKWEVGSEKVDKEVGGGNTKSRISPQNPASHLSHHTSNIEVVIVTGDRDMLQLVNKKVKVLMPLLGITKTALFDEKAVEEKYGVKPSQFIDYKALIGDASDGYPGVTGIGPKGAANLLKEYGTFENLYENIPSLPEKIGLKLATDAEQAALAKKLATIVTDAPIQFDLKKCKCTDFDPKALHDAFAEQGFKSLTARLDSLFGLKPEAEKKPADANAMTDNAGEPKEETKEGKKTSDQLELL